MINYQS